MFTGIIENTATVVDTHSEDGRLILNVSNPYKTSQLMLGDSVAVNGVCLTMTKLTEKAIQFDVSPETLACTTFDSLIVGQRLNLELAVTLQKPLGGHLVLGHVDDVATLVELNQQNDFIEMIFSGFKHPEWLIEKGSIAINGISLTINAILDKRISCMIIPHTLSHTSLSELVIGDRVNIEYDYVAKIVTRQNTLKSQQIQEDIANVY